MNSVSLHQEPPIVHASKQPQLTESTPASWAVIAISIILAVGVVVAIACLAHYTPLGRSAAALAPIVLLTALAGIYISACFHKVVGEESGAKQGGDPYKYKAK